MTSLLFGAGTICVLVGCIAGAWITLRAPLRDESLCDILDKRSTLIVAAIYVIGAALVGMGFASV